MPCPPPLSRRSFLTALAAGSSAFAPRLFAGDDTPKHILLRNGWQSINIGDVGHVPGMLRLIEQYMPGTRVTLWPTEIDNGADKLLQNAFPKLTIAKGTVNSSGKITSQALTQAFESADFLLHGSGSGVVAQGDVKKWHAHTGKAYGFYGISVLGVDDVARDVLSKASFLFCRDTKSVEIAKKGNVQCPVLEFGPDSTFGIHLRNDADADEFLREKGLEPRKFMCVISRLRYTPFANKPEAERKQRAEVSDQYKDADHAKFREAIIAWVRQTGQKVLLCPEVTYEIELMDPLLYNPLPDDVKKNVVKRDQYWMPDLAGSVYAKASLLLSSEMHSPIIAAAMGTPAILVRQPQDTHKGQMWRDIGLKDWIFEIDESTGEEYGARALAIHKDYDAALKYLDTAMTFVKKRQQETLAVLAKAVKG